MNRSKLRLIAAIALVAASGLFLSQAFGKTTRPRSGKAIEAAPLTQLAPTRPDAAVPPSGTLDPSNRSITYTDGPLAPNPTGVLGAPVCAGANTCSDFTVTINASSLAATHDVTWEVQWFPPNVDLDIFIEDAAGNLIANNNSTSDPSAIILPIPTNGTVYHLIVSASVGTAPLNGSISLTQKYPASQQGAGAPPRYMNYPAGASQANGANEPSIGVDWNPNVASLKDISGQTRKNTGGVAFFTFGSQEFRSNFDDCSSPAVNVWEDKSATFTQTFVLSDPIGFVDHFSSAQLGLGPNPPQTPGRVFTIDLIGGQGDSLGSYSDDDGNSYLPGGNGGAPAGPDHETLGGGPFHAPLPTPPSPAYPNVIYYCSQNGVQNAECSASYDGGLTFGPGVPLFNPTVCGGGIHGHVKVSPQGTAYVPNSSCEAGAPLGANGFGVSTDNGISWEERNVPNSTGSQDPAVGIGQNNVGKPVGQVPNTVYLGWISADNHAHAAHSPDEGLTWQDDIDVSSIFGIRKAVFPVMVAGDDNRAAYGFLGTDPDFVNKDVWHLYVATTYNGGHDWILVDTTPDDPVQIGVVCLLGLSCTSSNRNLLDFNGIDIDKEGRVLIGYTDGCLNCTNTQNISQSSQSHGTIARQSGGRRLFAAFDPVEPAPPRAPQVLSAVRVSTPAVGVLVSWLKPDNGGSPITGYNIYRGPTSGSEIFIAHVSGADTLKYLDQTANPVTNSFYKVTAINAVGESTYCRELSVNAAQPSETACQSPFLTETGPGVAGNVPSDPTQGELTIQRISAGEPFVDCADNSVKLVMKVNTLDPANTGQAALPPNSGWQILFDVVGTDNVVHTMYVVLDTFPPYDNTGIPNFAIGRRDPNPTTGGTVDTQMCFQQPPLFSCPALAGSTFSKDGTITFKLNLGSAISLDAPSAPAQGVAFTWDGSAPGTQISNIRGNTYLLAGLLLETVQTTGTTGPTYTRIGNLACTAGVPVAGLTATPMSGAPGLNVTFDASSSNDTSPCATIVSYTLDFGDGSAPVTHASPSFSHTYNTEGDFPARLTATDSAGRVSTAAQVVISVHPNVPQVTGVVSRKVHGGAGTFDLNLSPSGNPGIECRSGGANGDYQLVFVFSNTLSSVGSASVTGTGSVSNRSIGADTHQYIVDLTGVTSGQRITVTLNSVQDSVGNGGSVSQQMDVLVGDTNADGSVNSTDISQTKSQSGQSVTGSNFREDVNFDGSLNSADISLVKSKSGTGLP